MSLMGIFFPQNQPIPFFSALYTRNFGAKTHLFHKHSLHIASIKVTHRIIQAREPLSRQGETCFLNSQMPKNLYACPSKNKSTELDPHVPPLFPTIANHCSLIAACIMT